MVEHVTSSGKTDSIVTANSFGKSGKQRHNMSYDEFKRVGIKTPSNIGKAMLADLVGITEVIFGDKTKERLTEIDQMYEGDAKRFKPRMLRNKVYTVRKGNKHQAIKG